MPRSNPSPVDDPAFRRFYHEYRPDVLAYCRRRVGPQAAEDTSAEVFIAAWRKWPSVPKDDGALPWLYGAARREVLHHWRSAARYRRLVDRLRGQGGPSPQGPDHVVVESLESELARQALGRLRERDREVLRLATWEQLSHAEIAIATGVTEKAAAMRFVRAKRRFGDQYRALERHAGTSSRAVKGGHR